MPTRRWPRRDSGPWHPIRRRNECTRSFDGQPKHAYPDEASAWSAADSLTRQFSHRGERWVPYVCGRCGGWHVGRPGRFDRRENLRHHDAWAVELGDRAEACMRAENQGSPDRRLKMIAGLFAAAHRRAR